MATDRIIVHQAIAPGFLEDLKEIIARKPELDPPPSSLVSVALKVRLRDIISDALDSSECSESFGTRLNSENAASFNPMFLTGIPTTSKVWNMELFGPVAVISIVSGDEEAVNLANDTEYGLSAAVFTKDLRRGLTLAKQIKAG